MKPIKRPKTLKVANIIVSVLLVLLIGYAIYYIGFKSIASFSHGSIKVHEVKEHYKKDDIVVDISRPKLSGFTNKTFEKLLNEKIHFKILTDRNALELYSIQREHQEKFNFAVDYWVKSSGGIFSLKVTSDFYYGYVTNLPISIYYNIDIANNRLLTLGDLFIDDSYKERLYKYIVSVMPKNFLSYNYPELIKISDRTQFFIKDSNLYITFAKYEIASGASGEPEFMIPTAEIEDLLKEEYKDIF